jgi:chemotaxis protein CheY-P-specific phosphatase CheC
MSIEQLIEQIEENTEWMQTSVEDDVACISIENLESILSQFLNKQIELTK